MDHAIVEEARAAWRALEAAPDAARIVDLARLALGPLATVEREGGDMVGTDAYEVLRDGWPALRGWLAHPDAAVRAAAAYALAFLLEPADQTLPALAQAAATEPDPRQQAALILAAGRLRASVQAQQGTSPDVPFEGIRVDPAVRGPEVDPVVRGATALAQTFGLPSFPRSCQPDVAAAIEALAGPVGPWGGGDVATLAAAVRAGLWVQEAKPEREVAEVVFRSDNMIATLTPAGADDEEDEADAAEDAEEEGAEEEEEEEDADEDDDDARERPTPRVQLAGLHDVEWGALEHAYGSAGGVPFQLEALSAADPADRATALDNLESSIHHQGSVYSASVAAVPFLIALAGHAGLEGRAGILQLLAGIAVHDPAGCVVEGAGKWRSQAFDAVAAGGPTYVALLADPEPAVRSAAAYVLAYVLPVAEGALPALRAALRDERDRRARASLLLALGYLSRYLESRADAPVLAGYLDAPSPLIRTAAAFALAQMHGPATPPAALAVLDRARTEAAPVRGGWPWNRGQLAGMALAIRQALKGIDEVLADLERADAAGDDDGRRAAAFRATKLLFNDEPHGFDLPWHPDELDAPRRRTLAALITVGWPDGEAIGLPPTAEAARRMLGEGAGPVDQPLLVDGAPRAAWWLIYRVVGQALAPAALHAALAALSPEARVALIDDAFAAPHQLSCRRKPIEWDDTRDTIDAMDFTSRFILLAADVLGRAGAAGEAWAAATAAAQVPRGKDRDVVASIAAALVLARAATARGEVLDPRFDPLVAPDQVPADTYRVALRAVLEHLPAARGAALAEELEALEASDADEIAEDEDDGDDDD